MRTAFIIALICASVACQTPVAPVVPCTKTVQGMIDATFACIISGESDSHIIPLNQIQDLANSAEAFATQCLGTPFPMPSDACFSSIQKMQAPIIQLIADIQTNNQMAIVYDVSQIGLEIVAAVGSCGQTNNKTCSSMVQMHGPVIKDARFPVERRIRAIQKVTKACL